MKSLLSSSLFSGGSLLKASLLTVLLGGALACQKGGPLKVDKAEPDQGIVAGGDHVTIKGGGFEPGKTQVEVRFGRARAEQVSIASADAISVVTPPGEKGPVDITLMFDDGAEFKIPGGFHYVLPGGSDDVRKAFFNGKPGSTSTNTTPPAAKP